MFRFTSSALLLFLVLFVIFIQGQQIISVTNGEIEGEWGTLEKCPAGSRAVAYKTQNEPDTPIADDSALNTIILFCSDINSTYITSKIGYTGNVQPLQECLFGSYLKSFQLRVNPYSDNATDNTAVNNIRFKCSNDREISGTGNLAGFWGEYSEECTVGICGIQTLVKGYGGDDVDNTALNDVRFSCC